MRVYYVKFTADDPDTLYEMTKDFDWTSIMSVDKTFSIDSVVNSDTFTHSRYVTYRVKDGIVDFFKDRFGADKRPGVRLQACISFSPGATFSVTHILPPITALSPMVMRPSMVALEYIITLLPMIG